MKRLLLSSLMLFIMCLVPLKVSAVDLFNSACSDSASASSAVCSEHTTGNPITGSNGVILKVTNILAIIAGAAAVILIIIAGIRLVTSAGDSNAVSGARQSILYALIGLVIIFLAQAIITFVIKKL